MSNEWPEVPLGELLTRCKDETLIQEDQTYSRLTIRLNGKGIDLRDRLEGIAIGTKTQFIVRAGQLLLSKIDARNGAFGIVPSECDGAIITGNFWAYDSDANRLHLKFFDYLTKTPLFLDFCIRASSGTTNRRYLQEPLFLKQAIPLPPLPEQRRIVAKIEELAAKIEETTSLRQRIKEHSAALCRSILGVGSVVPTPMHEIVRLRETDTVVVATDRYHFAGVYCFGRGVFAGEEKTGLDFAYKSLTRLHAGDFTYPKLMAWEGALGIVPPECDGLFVSPEYPVFEVNTERVLPEVLDAYFRSPDVWPQLAEISTGTNVRRRRLHPTAFLNYRVPLPPMETQLQLRAVKCHLDTARALQVQTQAELDALVPSILDRAFKGEL